MNKPKRLMTIDDDHSSGLGKLSLNIEVGLSQSLAGVAF